MTSSFHDVIKSKYLLLTTFTKDGRPKPTPIRGVPKGDKLLVITADGSWKTKRIKNTPRVTLAKSGSLGKLKSDDVEGVARVLPKSETRRVYTAVLKRYWYHAPWFYVHSDVRGESTRFTRAWRSRRRLVSQASQPLGPAFIGAL